MTCSHYGAVAGNSTLLRAGRGSGKNPTAKKHSCLLFTIATPERMMPSPPEKLKMPEISQTKQIKTMANKKAKKPAAKKPVAKKKKK
jgi:hypothetical protein